ncbi:MAG: LysM peptidoglycan-binding domain-containing protein [Anaerostipes sp.]|nr:LysM peptidoglycan-binding domain-containing protein [Anaerostipes sp.]
MRQENQLPKNIRQIGSPVGNEKLYIEDFVITFLKMLAKDNHTFVRGAILFGEKKIIENETVIFISGAIEGENIELDLDETVFDDTIWKEIYQKKDIFFPELEVMGWGLSRMGFSTRLNDKIKKTHFENFPGQGKVLYVVDMLEGEDAFYIYRGQDLVKQAGYYIYYGKNPQMQSYIADRKEELKEVISYENMQEAKRDEKIVRQFRSTVKAKKKKTRNKNLFHKISSSAAVLLFCFLIGTMVYTVRGDRSVSFKDAVSGAVEAMGDGAKEGMKNEKTESITVTETKKEIEKTTAKKITQTTAKETTYIVKYGDKLVRISQKIYGSEKYLNYILVRNNMKKTDKIYPGQKLIIPSISN